MAVLTETTITTTSENTAMQIQQRAINPLTHISSTTLLTLLTPAFTNTLVLFSYLQLFLRSYALTTAALLLSHSYCFTKSFLFRSFSLSSHLLHQSRKIIHTLYKRAEPIRQKLFFEFMVFILNPGLGHGLIVLLFWPGWLVLWMGLCAWWLVG